MFLRVSPVFRNVLLYKCLTFSSLHMCFEEGQLRTARKSWRCFLWRLWKKRCPIFLELPPSAKQLSKSGTLFLKYFRNWFPMSWNFGQVRFLEVEVGIEDDLPEIIAAYPKVWPALWCFEKWLAWFGRAGSPQNQRMLGYSYIFCERSVSLGFLGKFEEYGCFFSILFRQVFCRPILTTLRPALESGAYAQRGAKHSWQHVVHQGFGCKRQRCVLRQCLTSMSRSFLLSCSDFCSSFPSLPLARRIAMVCTKAVHSTQDFPQLLKKHAVQIWSRPLRCMHLSFVCQIEVLDQWPAPEWEPGRKAWSQSFGSPKRWAKIAEFCKVCHAFSRIWWIWKCLSCLSSECGKNRPLQICRSEMFRVFVLWCAILSSSLRSLQSLCALTWYCVDLCRSWASQWKRQSVEVGIEKKLLALASLSALCRSLRARHHFFDCPWQSLAPRAQLLKGHSINRGYIRGYSKIHEELWG